MIKKIADLTEATKAQETDIVCIVDLGNGETKKITLATLLKSIIPKNAAAHNGIYRGKNITNLFYDGTLSEQIAAGTFDDIFIGDYIIGKVSNRKYIVADLNYRLHCGDLECTTPHILMVPERIMGTAKMNDTNITTGAYINSKMYTEYLAPFKTVIKNDFEDAHILKHKNLFANATTNGYESAGGWFDSDIELMNETMVYGGNIFKNSIANGASVPYNYTVDKSQLSLFRLKPETLVTLNDAGQRFGYWLRDLVSSSVFASVYGTGAASNYPPSNLGGVRPAFLIY